MHMHSMDSVQCWASPWKVAVGSWKTGWSEGAEEGAGQEVGPGRNSTCPWSWD